MNAIATSGGLTLRSGQGTGTPDLSSGTNPVTLRGTTGDDTLTAGSEEFGDYVLIGKGGLDHLYAGDGAMSRTVFLINKASDLVAGEVYQGNPHGENFGSYQTSMIGNSIAADISFVDITLTDVREISGFSGTLTLTAGQLADLDAVQAGAIRLAEGGAVQLARWTDAPDLYLSDTDTTLTFTAGNDAHHLGYGNYYEHYTGVLAGFAVHGGAGDDVITATRQGYEGGNETISQVGVKLFGGGGDDRLTGAAGHDLIVGGLGDDRVFGGMRGDHLIASDGHDTLTGGRGSDVFVIGVQSGSAGDRITDFSGLGTALAADRIRIVDGATAVTYLGADGFSANGGAEVRFAHGMLKIDFDGDGTADSSFVLTGMSVATQLTQDDFI